MQQKHLVNKAKQGFFLSFYFAYQGGVITVYLLDA